jgi:hypothetical protein
MGEVLKSWGKWDQIEVSREIKKAFWNLESLENCQKNKIMLTFLIQAHWSHGQTALYASLFWNYGFLYL